MKLKVFCPSFKVFVLTFLVTLAIVLTGPSAIAAETCNTVHRRGSGSKDLEEQLSLSKKMQSRYMHSIDIRRSVETPSGEIATLIERRYIRANEDANASHALEVTKLLQLISMPIAKGSENYYGNFEHIVEESIEFVLKNYAQRRAWTPEFRDHLYEQALRYSTRSTYIQFYADSDLKGTLKIISADQRKQELLPVEENLNIKIPSNGTLKFELGNFSIDRNFNTQAFTEILFQLMLHASELEKQPGHDAGAMVYFTYADEFSLRMYRSLGFKPVPGFEKPIEKDGTKWVTVGISSADVLKIPQFMQQSRPYWDPAVLSKMLQFFPNLQDYSSENLSVAGYRIGKYSVHLSRPIRAAIGALNRDYQYFVFHIQDFDGYYFRFPIPVDFLPLKEGAKLSVQKGRYQLSYKNGNLEVREKNGIRNRKIILKIDPQLKFPKALDVNP